MSITHEDQEVDKLKFQVLTSKDDYNYVQVDGPEGAILNWKTRVEGTDSTLDEINTVIASIPPSAEDQKIVNLQNQNAQILLALVNGGLM
ncbi:hypothetical protein [Clostridium aciditolerans]|uniref:hypothetical protein n=1 Tax=Clostridium aciditolerans TaxID=339861 RepID=UPI001B3CA14E|nr:hypothetical protein [Clostridium aciditolerans]